MYKILNFLFGYDYIHWSNSCDKGIARIHTDYNSNVFYYRYKITKVTAPIDKASNFLWLTCSPAKYGVL